MEEKGDLIVHDELKKAQTSLQQSNTLYFSNKPSSLME
jgi:hypothetical protein